MGNLNFCRRGNNTFSVATFKTNPDAELEWEQEKNDSKAFWNDLLPEACGRVEAGSTAVEDPEASNAGGLRKRNRGHVNYRENPRRHDVSDSDEEKEKPKKSGRKQCASNSADGEKSKVDEDDIDHWSDKELKRLEDRLFALGRGRTGESSNWFVRQPSLVFPLLNILVFYTLFNDMSAGRCSWIPS